MSNLGLTIFVNEDPESALFLPDPEGDLTEEQLLQQEKEAELEEGLTRSEKTGTAEDLFGSEETDSDAVKSKPESALQVLEAMEANLGLNLAAEN